MATAEGGPVLAVASHRREFAGLTRHAARVSPLGWPIRHAVNTRISDSEWILAANGEGRQCAAEAMRCALAACSPRAVVSTGLCGALDPALKAGDIFAPDEVVDEAGQRYNALPPPSRRAVARGALISLDRVAATAREKAELRNSGARVVEMEAGAVAGAAQARGIPFYCIRVVSDAAGVDLPVDFNRFRTAAGSIDAGRVARKAAVTPRIWLPMVRLAIDAARATTALGEYLADCRF